MKLQDFVSKFVNGNSLIRILIENSEGHETVLENFNKVEMCWKIAHGDKDCLYIKYLENNVRYITDIVCHGPYSEAINIVIEE